MDRRPNRDRLLRSVRLSRPKAVRYASPQALGYILLAGLAVAAAAEATVPTKSLAPLQMQLDSLRSIGDRAVMSGDNVLLEDVTKRERSLYAQINSVDPYHKTRWFVFLITGLVIFSAIVALVIDRLT